MQIICRADWKTEEGFFAAELTYYIRVLQATGRGMPDVIRARISSQDTADDLVHYVIQCMQCEDTWHRKLLCVKDAISVRQRVVQKEFTRLTDNQKDTFRKMTGEICRANENLCSTRPDACPVWGTVHPMLYRLDKKIRWYCGSCGHKFAYVSHTITFSLKIARDVFLDTLNMVSIRKNVVCFQQQSFAWSN